MEVAQLLTAIETLAPSYKRVIQEFSKGKSSSEIARSLGISSRTVKNYKNEIPKALKIKARFSEIFKDFRGNDALFKVEDLREALKIKQRQMIKELHEKWNK